MRFREPWLSLLQFDFLLLTFLKSSRRGHFAGRGCFALLCRQNLAFINPALHANHAIRRARLGESVIDVGAQRVQRQTPLQIPLRAGDFIAVQSSADADFDALAAETQRRVDRLAHRAPEADAFFQLQRNRFRYQLRVQLRLMHFLNVDVHLARRALLQLLLELVDFRALAPNDDSRTRRLNNDAQLIAWTLDFNRADARRLELVLQLRLQLDVFEQQLVVVALHEPARLPGLGVTKPESVRMYFLSHRCS